MDIPAALRALARARLLVRDLSGSCAAEDVRKARAGLVVELMHAQQLLDAPIQVVAPVEEDADFLGNLSAEKSAPDGDCEPEPGH